MFRAVFFDIDGTLIRTGGAGMKAFEKTFAVEFDAPGATDGLAFAGRTDMAIARDGFRRAGLNPSPASLRRFFDRYVFWLDYFLGELDGAPCPGVIELLESLRRRSRAPLLGLLTGNIRLGAEIKLRHYKLWRYFRIGAFGDDHEERDRLAFLAQQRAAAKLGRPVEGQEILVIGDTPLDISCGRAIGASVLAVATGGYTAAELRRHKPDRVVATLAKVTVAEVCGGPARQQRKRPKPAPAVPRRKRPKPAPDVSRRKRLPKT